MDVVHSAAMAAAPTVGVRFAPAEDPPVDQARQTSEAEGHRGSRLVITADPKLLGFDLDAVKSEHTEIGAWRTLSHDSAGLVRSGSRFQPGFRRQGSICLGIGIPMVKLP